MGTWQADLVLLAVTAIWGTTFVLVKEGLAAMGPYHFLAWRFGIATLVLVALFGKRALAAPRAAWQAGAVVGFLLFLGFALQTMGLQYTAASEAAFITGLSVILVPILATLGLRTRPDAWSWIGVGLATPGLALISLQGRLLPSVGDLLVLGCAFAFALQILAVERTTLAVDVGVLTTVEVGATFLLSLALTPWDRPTTTVSGQLLAALGVTSVLATVVVFMMQNWAQRYTSSTHTALIFTMEPVFAYVFAHWWLGEALAPSGLLGGSLILLGMLAAEVPRLRQMAPQRRQQEAAR